MKAFRIVLAVGLAAACGTSPKSPSLAQQHSSAPERVDPSEAGELTILPGTRVAVPLPTGFVRKPGVLELVHEQTGAKIVAREFNRPFNDFALDLDALERGVVMLSEQDVVVGGMRGSRWELENRELRMHVIGMDFGDDETSFLVMAKFPVEVRASMGADVLHALLGARVDPELETQFGNDFHAIFPREHELDVRTVQTEDGPVEYTSFLAEAADDVACHLQVTRYSKQNLALIRPEDIDETMRVSLAEQLDAQLLGGRRLSFKTPVMEIEARQTAKRRHLAVRYFFTGEALVQLLVSYPQGPEPAVVRTLIDGLLPTVTER